jgi:hypothetical protein
MHLLLLLLLLQLRCCPQQPQNLPLLVLKVQVLQCPLPP